MGRRLKAELRTRVQPAPEQPPDLRHHFARVAILPIVQPSPAMRQSQIEPQFVEMGVGRAQMFLARGSSLGLSVEDRFLKIERGAHQSLGHSVAVEFRESFRSRPQPDQQIEGFRQDDHVVGHFGFVSLFTCD